MLSAIKKGIDILDSLETDSSFGKMISLQAWFFFFYVLFNWNFLTAVILVDENLIWEKFSQLKNEYLFDQFFHVTSFVDLFLILGQHIVGPAACVYIAIWHFTPLIVNRVYNKNVDSLVARKTKYFQSERLVQEERQKTAAQTQSTIKQEQEKLQSAIELSKTKEEIKEAQPQTLEKEYQQFKQLSYFDEFYSVIDSVYEHDGQINWGNNPTIASNMLAFLDASEIITIVNKHKIKLTEKGNFFIKKYVTDPDRVQNDGQGNSSDEISIDDIPF